MTSLSSLIQVDESHFVKTMPKLSFLKEAPKERFRSTVNREAPSSVDRKGGDYGFGVIYQASLIAHGEALGHGMWIDDEMLSQVHDALAEKGNLGIKARFTHPGLSSDGMGKTLGRFKNPTMKDGKVFADLHFIKAAHSSPDGDLASYVMDLAEESPDLFGISIVFSRDVAAEDNFREDHSKSETRTDEYDGEEYSVRTFTSPDPKNEKNLRHARLSQLLAADAVDEPAANPDGLFHREASLMKEACEVASFALGLSDDAPKTSFFSEVHPERVRGFFQRFLESEGLQITKKADQVDQSHFTKEEPSESNPVMKSKDATPNESAPKAAGPVQEPLANTPETPSASQEKFEVDSAEYAEFQAHKKAQEKKAQEDQMKAFAAKAVEEALAKQGAARTGESPASPNRNTDDDPVASYESLYKAEVEEKRTGDRFNDLKTAKAFKTKYGTKAEYEAKNSAE